MIRDQRGVRGGARLVITYSSPVSILLFRAALRGILVDFLIFISCNGTKGLLDRTGSYES